MAKERQDDENYQVTLARIQQETDWYINKLQILHASKGNFSASQAADIIWALKRPEDKIKAIKIMQPRLCRMSCQESRDILDGFSIHNDRLAALDVLKRVMTDYQTVVGEEYILSKFPFEADKRKALNILRTVRSDVWDKMASGGHQLYAALGGLFSSARPLNIHMYGDLAKQELEKPGRGPIEIPHMNRVGVIPSIYTGHPSYAYPVDKDYCETRGYPGTVGFPAKETGPRHYSGGAPTLGLHSGAAAPTGFPRLDARGFMY